MRGAFLVVGLAAALGGTLDGRAGQQAAPPQAPVFRALVNLVRVDVVVTDAHGQPVTDLNPGDFSLSEGGRPQEILSFQYVAIPVSHRTVDLAQPAAPSPDVASNAPASPNSRVFVIIIDDQQIIPHDITHVKQVMTDFLRALSPDDQIAMIFTGRSDLGVNFTSDVGRLVKAVDGVRGAFGFGLDVMGVDSSGRAVDQLYRARTALDTVKFAANALAGSGYARRAIVYVSGYSIIQPPRPKCEPCIALDAEQKQVYDLARRAGVPIYTLDPRGFPIGGGAAWRPTTQQAIEANVRIQQNHLTEIAENTGGLALVNQPDLTKAVDTIVADNGSFYVLGYSPNPGVHDGKFHPIEVKVHRPGLIVRPRAGYVADKPTSATIDTTQLLTEAIAKGVDVSGLTLHATAAPVAVAAKGMTTVVTVDVTYPAGAFLSATFDDTLRVNVIALDPDAHIKASMGHEWHVSGQQAADRSHTTHVDELLDLPSQPLTLRIGVASQTIGRAGTVQLPVDVPNVSSRKLVVGGLVLGLAGDVGLDTAGFGAIQAIVPFQPLVTRTFNPTDTIRVFAPIFWTTKDPVVNVSVLAEGEGRSGRPIVATLDGAPVTSGPRVAVFDRALSLKDVAPGPCRVTVAARLGSGPSVTRQIPCSVDLPR